MNKDNRQNRIDNYLLGRAGREERLEFEEEITRNAELSNELADTELAMAAIELAEDRALKARLQKLESTFSSTSSGTTAPEEAKVVTMQPRRSGRMKLFAYAAALLLALAVGWWALNTSSGFEPELLAMESFEPYQNITTGTVRGEADPTAEAAAFAAYDAGDFAAAETKLSALPVSNVNQFYLGQSLLAQEKFEEASSIFTPLSKVDTFPLAKESNYYNALAFLGAGKVTDAKNTLTQIGGDAEHPMQQEAKKLLAKM